MTDTAFGQTERLCQITHGDTAGGELPSNLTHLLLGYFCGATSFAARGALRMLSQVMLLTGRQTPLFLGIMGVISDRAEKQMIRANATAVVAMVADKQSCRNGAKCQFITVPMGTDYPPLFANVNRSVPRCFDAASPEPTTRRLVYLRPKACFGSDDNLLQAALLTARDRAVVVLCLLRSKHLATGSAGARLMTAKGSPHAARRTIFPYVTFAANQRSATKSTCGMLRLHTDLLRLCVRPESVSALLRLRVFLIITRKSEDRP